MKKIKSSQNRVSALPALCALLLAAGCAVGPHHKAPEVATPETFRGEKGANDKSFADLPWWEIYRDPTLFGLIKVATEENIDLRIALSRVEIARQNHRAAVWSLFPTIGVQAGVGESLGQPNIPSVYPLQSATGTFGAGVGASWEPDVWGRLRRITEVAQYQMEAADEDRRGVYIALVGDVADLYFTLSAIDQQKSYADRAVATRSDTLTLFSQRASGGVGNDLEVARARASLKQAEAATTQLDLARITNENAINYLLARPPGPIENRASLEQLKEPPAIPAGLPSTLLQRRPDIRFTEKRLLAANAQIGAEMADFFPKFELTGFLGVVSPDLQQAQFARGGVGLFSWTLPFLGGERERAEYDRAKATFELTAAEYERSVVNAFREVANSLAEVQTLRDRRAAVQEVVDALDAALRLAVDRYRGGVANYLDVLTVQEQLLVSQLDLATLAGQQLSAVARLYRNLGGGWVLEDEEDEDGKSTKTMKKSDKGPSKKKG